MKKLKLTNILLLALPLLTVLVASNPASVTVFDGETTRYLSWLATVPESPWGWCAPVAALMNYVIFAMAVLWCLFKKDWCIKGIFGLSFAAATIAVAPILIQSQLKIVPNAMGAVFLMVECFAAYLVIKNPSAEKKNEEPTGRRLEKH